MRHQWMHVLSAIVLFFVLDASNVVYHAHNHVFDEHIGKEEPLSTLSIGDCEELAKSQELLHFTLALPILSEIGSITSPCPAFIPGIELALPAAKFLKDKLSGAIGVGGLLLLFTQIKGIIGGPFKKKAKHLRKEVEAHLDGSDRHGKTMAKYRNNEITLFLGMVKADAKLTKELDQKKVKLDAASAELLEKMTELASSRKLINIVNRIYEKLEQNDDDEEFNEEYKPYITFFLQEMDNFLTEYSQTTF